MLEHQIKNRKDWYRMVRGLAMDRYANFSSIRTDENGWSWIPVGHNASHSFYVGHDKDYNRFATKSVGEEYDPAPEGLTDEEYDKWVYDPAHSRIETYIHRESYSLTETLSGAYLGHF